MSYSTEDRNRYGVGSGSHRARPRGNGAAVEIPPPVDVATIIAEREPGQHYPEGYLNGGEVARAWPAVWRFDAMITANHVRFYDTSNYTSWGTILGPRQYCAEDVQRVADEIAAGTAVLEPEWRTDTEVGRRLRHEWWLAGRRRRKRRQSFQAASLIILVLVILLAAVLLSAAD